MEIAMEDTKTLQINSSTACIPFSSLEKLTKERVAFEIKSKSSQLLLSPIVEDYVYSTTRTLDFGDYYAKYGKGLWEHAVNKNGDYFDVTELEDIDPTLNIPRYLSYRTAHVYQNHDARSLEYAIGVVFDAVMVKNNYEDMHITTLFGVDKKKAPSVARMLELYPQRVPVSMGCSIQYSICTACGHTVKSQNDLCDCLRYSRLGRVNGKKVAELLKGVSFYDLSIVTTPACPTAYVVDAISKIVPGYVLKIASESSEGQQKLALINTVYQLIRTARTFEEKKNLNYKFDLLIDELYQISLRRR